MIGVTQPNRVAVISDSHCVSAEMYEIKDAMMNLLCDCLSNYFMPKQCINVILLYLYYDSAHVGYSVKFEDNTSENTILKYMTDEILLRELQLDMTLSKYAVIILNEAGERSMYTDVLMSVVKEVMLSNISELKLVIMTTKLNATKFSKYFNNAPILKIHDSIHPVEIVYNSERENNYVKAAMHTALQIHLSEPVGDILVFLASQTEIEQLCNILVQEISKLGANCGFVKIYTLHSAMPTSKLKSIFESTALITDFKPARKIIILTNIVDTSLVIIDSIVYIIDSGFCKQKQYNPRKHIETTLVTPISKASAIRRAALAGKIKPGKVFRLYTERLFNCDLQDNTVPEILRSDLSNVILTLKKLGINDLVHFDYMDPPAPEILMRALETLNYLGALDDEGDMTNSGSMMAELPVDVKLAKALLVSETYNCSHEILSIVSLLCIQYLFENNKFLFKMQFNHVDGDCLSLLNMYHAWKQNSESINWCVGNNLNYEMLMFADNIRRHLETILVRLGVKLCSNDFGSSEYSVSIRKALLNGFFMQVAYFDSDSNCYSIVKHNQIVKIHPSSVVIIQPEWIIYHEYVTEISNFVKYVSVIDGLWLLNIAPQYYDLNSVPECAAKSALERLSLQRKTYDK
eukprot:53207_1